MESRALSFLLTNLKRCWFPEEIHPRDAISLDIPGTAQSPYIQIKLRCYGKLANIAPYLKACRSRLSLRKAETKSCIELVIIFNEVGEGRYVDKTSDRTPPHSCESFAATRESLEVGLCTLDKMPTLKGTGNARSSEGPRTPGSKFVYFLHPKGTVTRTRRAEELLQADARSHAARTAHARAKAKLKKDEIHGGTASRSSRRGTTAIRIAPASDDSILLPLQTSKRTVQLSHELVPFNPRPACFDYAAHDEEMLVQDALHYAKAFFWVRLAPSSATTPHPEQLFYSHMQLSKNAFRGYMIAVTMGLNYSVADHPQRNLHEKMRTRYTGILLKEIRNVIDDLPIDRLDEVIATVLILSVTSQLAVKPRADLPASPFRSPLAEAQLLDFWGVLKFDRAHLNGMRRLVELGGGLDKMVSPEVAALLQMSVRSCVRSTYTY